MNHPRCFDPATPARWRNQQRSRNLQFATIDQRLRCVQRFLDHVNEDPWNWTPAMVEFVSDEFRRSTLRSALDRTVKEAMQRRTEDCTS